MKFEVDVLYFERQFDTVTVDSDDRTQAEYEALNTIRDSNPEAREIDILEVREVA